jgi:hypothetical protein
MATIKKRKAEIPADEKALPLPPLPELPRGYHWYGESPQFDQQTRTTSTPVCQPKPEKIGRPEFYRDLYCPITVEEEKKCIIFAV